MYLLLIVFVILWTPGDRGNSFDEALLEAHCIVRCPDKSCMKNCKQEADNVQDPKLPEAANANASLLCKDENYVVIKHNPGVFVIEQNTIGGSQQSKASNGTSASFANLKAHTQYQYTLHRVSEEGVSLPDKVLFITTNEANHEPNNVKNISVERLEVADNVRKGYIAKINFTPAEDRSCYYNVLWTGGNRFNQKSVQEEFNTTLKYLDYDTNYAITVSALNRQGFKGSNKTLIWYATPSCLTTHKNLTICAPKYVEGLRAKEEHVHGKIYNVTVLWDEPDFLPDNYSIRIQRVGATDDDPIDQTVSGNVTEAFFPAVEIAPQYEVYIIAESSGGTSPKVQIFRRVQEQESNTQEVAAVIILSSVIFIVGMIGMFYTYKCTKSKRYRRPYKFFKSLEPKEGVMDVVKDTLKGDFSVEDGEPLVQRDEFEILPDRLKIGEVLGSGAFGVVKLGTLEDGCGQVIDVAIKMMKDNASIEDKQSFQQEILMMKSTDQHPNIVSLLGYCTMGTSPLLVVEYCSRGDLQTFLRTIWDNMVATMAENRMFSTASTIRTNLKTKSSLLHFELHDAQRACQAGMIANQLYDIQQELLHGAETVTTADLLNFSRQIATGMAFLSSNRIVHRDLAARNVLVCADKTVKISDFGLSRDIYRENVYKKHGMGLLPIKWMAIESLTHQLYTTHSDVWSFGILLWEIMTLGSTPYPGTPTNKVLKLLKSGYRMERPPNCDMQLYNIMLSCWCSTPRYRPTFTKLRRDLDQLLCSVTDNQYLDLGGAIDGIDTSSESQNESEN